MKEVRAKSIIDESWVKGQYLEFSNPNPPCGWIVITDHEEHPELSGNPIEDLTDCIPVYPETVGEYTGLKDKNGKEIYEGDILSDWTETDEGLIESKLHVFWCNKTGAWKLDSSYNQDESIGDLLSDELAGFSYSVTGNVHEQTKDQ